MVCKMTNSGSDSAAGRHDGAVTASTENEAPRERGRQIVPSVMRAVRILNTLAAEPASVSLASLSRRLELPRSSTLALCNTLVATELLVRNPDGTYRMGPHVLELGRALLGQTDIHSEFERVLSELNLLPEHTVVCAVLRGRDAVYIGRRRGSHPVGVSYEIGIRLPAHCTASGLAMLSSLSDEQLMARYSDPESLVTLTVHSISSVQELLERVAEVRSRGYAIDDEETALGMLCIGAPVRDDSGAAMGAVAASMAKAALQMRELPSIATDVQRLAFEISAGLGGPGG
jgi:DNA-binding IclR family transcriptional regulator